VRHLGKNGEWHPEDALEHPERSALVAKFLYRHDLTIGDWDERDDLEAHTVLRWVEPGVSIGAVVCLGRGSYTLDIGRDRHIGKGNMMPLQRIQITNDYDFGSPELTRVLEEIWKHRRREKRKKKSA